MSWRKSSDVVEHLDVNVQLQDTHHENDIEIQVPVPVDGNGILPVGRIPYVLEMHRGLKSRHIQLIALGGSIGTGLFVGTGTTLSLAGPAPLVLCKSPQASLRF